jgi:hypothetical protein
MYYIYKKILGIDIITVLNLPIQDISSNKDMTKRIIDQSL